MYLYCNWKRDPTKPYWDSVGTAFTIPIPIPSHLIPSYPVLSYPIHPILSGERAYWRNIGLGELLYSVLYRTKWTVGNASLHHYWLGDEPPLSQHPVTQSPRHPQVTQAPTPRYLACQPASPFVLCIIGSDRDWTSLPGAGICRVASIETQYQGGEGRGGARKGKGKGKGRILD